MSSAMEKRRLGNSPVDPVSRQGERAGAGRAFEITRRELLERSAGLGVAGVFLAVAAMSRRAQSASPLKIGCMGPFTGPTSKSGEAIKKGTLMALDEAREEKEIPITIDGEKRDIEIVWIDSQADPDVAAAAVTDAINNQGVEFLINGWHSSVAMAVMDSEAPFKIIHIGHLGETQYVAEKINKEPDRYRGWFKGWPSPPILTGLYGAPLKEFLDSRLWKPANRKAAILAEDTGFGHGWGEALVNSLEKAGLEPLPYDVTPLAETEFASFLSKYKEQGVSLVAIGMGGNVGVTNFAKQFRSHGLKALLIAHGITQFSGWYDMAGDASDFVITMDSPAPIAPWQFRWMTRYNLKYGEAPSLSSSGIPYDYTRLAIKILNRAGTLDFETLIKTIYETPYDGVWNRYEFATEPGPNALSANEVMTGLSYREGFFFPMVQLLGGRRKIVWPLKYSESRFKQPPWI